jgi:hypothetical protein
VVLYEMLRPASFHGDRLPEIVEHILHTEPEPADAIAGRFPALAHIVDRTLAKVSPSPSLGGRCSRSPGRAPRVRRSTFDHLEPGPEALLAPPAVGFLFLIVAGLTGLP